MNYIIVLFDLTIFKLLIILMVVVNKIEFIERNQNIKRNNSLTEFISHETNIKLMLI